MNSEQGDIILGDYVAQSDDVRSEVREGEGMMAQMPIEGVLCAPSHAHLAAWDATEQAYPQMLVVPQLIGHQAALAPEALAITMGEQSLSYGELNRRANQLAHHLQSLGVGAETLVGICLERSPDMVVGLLGILKAGGAYVPLDPAYPPDRRTFMLADSQARVLVTKQHIREQLPSYADKVVCFDSDATLLAHQSEHDPVCLALLASLAYVIYTSGSTGQPKGVAIEHSSLLNLLFWHRRVFGVTPSDRATQVAGPGFDATGWEIWPYLTAGASVHLPNEDIRLTPALLRDWLVYQRITISFLPTALAERMLDLAWPPETALRFLLTGAEALHRYPPAGLPFQFVNNYGPTEATVVATSGIIPPVEHPTMLPSIGKQIDNTQIYLLDEQLRQVPPGEQGEIYIGGHGVARGYLNRPALTTERFIPHPFSTKGQERLYKTGDFARFLPDGQLAFVGRVDHQIKIRGYRIEPDEIVAMMNTHPAVQASVVVAREDEDGEKRLVAYVVLLADAHITSDSLQEHLEQHLPDYMIPAIFVPLDALPINPNGKVDWSALPAPDEVNTMEHDGYVAPRTAIEQRLSDIVCSLLKIDKVGIDDNFFMLGGHSLLGTQLIAYMADTFNVDLSLRVLFSIPTIRQLGALVEERILEKLTTMSDEEAQQILQD